MKSWFRIAISAWVCVASGAAYGDPAGRLHSLLAPMSRYAADFEQVVMGVRGQRLQTLGGTIRLARPGRFRWEVASPYPQLVLADGTRLYVYDPDLEQVSVQPLDDAMDGTPALLLTEPEADLDALFDVFSPAAEDDTETFVLTPRDEASLFREVRLRFVADVLTGLDIIDHLDQVTQITFSNAVLDPVLESSAFEFEIPPDTDVIGDVPDRNPAG